MDLFTNNQDVSTSLPFEFTAEGASTVKLTKSWYPYIIACDIVPIIAAGLLNLLPILAYVKYDTLRTPTTLLICNQSVADVLAATQSFLFVIFNYTEWGIQFASNNKYACLIMVVNVLISILMSGVNILLLSIERLIAVLCPYKYYIWVTESSVKKSLGAVWIGFTVLASLPLFGVNIWQSHHRCLAMFVLHYIYMTYLILLNLLIMLVLTAVANIIIAFIAFKKSRVQPVSMEPSSSTGTGPAGGSDKVENYKKDLKITKMLLTVVGIFYLSWAPYSLLTFLFLFPPKSWLIAGPPEGILIFHELSKVMLLWVSVANPIIYAWKNRKYKIAFKRLLGLDVSNESLQ